MLHGGAPPLIRLGWFRDPIPTHMGPGQGLAGSKGLSPHRQLCAVVPPPSCLSSSWAAHMLLVPRQDFCPPCRELDLGASGRESFSCRLGLRVLLSAATYKLHHNKGPKRIALPQRVGMKVQDQGLKPTQGMLARGSV